MKLRNKKTGEIGNLKPYGGDGRIWVWVSNRSIPEYRYNSLAELNAEWEDYEEPKDGRTWFLDFDDVPGWISYGDNPITDHCYDDWNELGICFETKEEAEKAVEKLKAWKRLKDKGFRFETFNFDRQMVTNGKVNLMIKASYNVGYVDDTVKLSELELLFGGEE